MNDLDALLATTEPEPVTSVSTATPRRCKRHQWRTYTTNDGLPYVTECARCLTVKDEARSRRGRQSRNYGNRAELEAARRYGGVKVGHAGGPVDIRGKDFVTQMRTKRRQPPAEWRTALAAMDGERGCPRMLIRFVLPTGPEDYFIFRAKDFLDWFGKDQEENAA